MTREQYSVPEIERIARVAFQMAQKRRGRVCSVDKANVLESSRLWRATVTRIHDEEFPQVELSHMYVDNCAMQLVRNPGQFDVIVTLEHLRRHPLRRGLHDQRQHRHARQRQPERRQGRPL